MVKVLLLKTIVTSSHLLCAQMLQLLPAAFKPTQANKFHQIWGISTRIGVYQKWCFTRIGDYSLPVVQISQMKSSC